MSLAEKQEDAAEALSRAIKHRDAGDDSTALRLANMSMRIHANDGARELVEWIEKFGDGSKYALAADSVLSSPNYYDIFNLPYLAPFPIQSLHKSYLKMSRDLHPDRAKARRSEEAFKHLGTAKACLSDEYLKTKYDCQLQGLPPPPKPPGYGVDPNGSPQNQTRGQRQQQAEQEAQRAHTAACIATIVKSLKLQVLRYVCESLQLTKSGNKTELSLKVQSHFSAECARNDPQAALAQLNELTRRYSDYEAALELVKTAEQQYMHHLPGLRAAINAAVASALPEQHIAKLRQRVAYLEAQESQAQAEASWAAEQAAWATTQAQERAAQRERAGSAAQQAAAVQAAASRAAQAEKKKRGEVSARKAAEAAAVSAAATAKAAITSIPVAVQAQTSSIEVNTLQNMRFLQSFASFHDLLEARAPRFP